MRDLKEADAKLAAQTRCEPLVGLTERARYLYSNKGRWALSATFALAKAYPIPWFIDGLGQEIRSNDRMKHWFGLDQWIKVT